MSYAHFTISELSRKFALDLDETTDLFPDVPDAPLRAEFLDHLNATLPLAMPISSEKARSEFIIAPILGELWLINERKVGIHSGVDFNVDELRVVGICDYIITRSPEKLFVKAPVLMLVEAKSEISKAGYAQCIAEMVAAQIFNAGEGNTGDRVYGAVTVGELWRFFKLEGATVCIDVPSYHIRHLAKIMGILLHVTKPSD